VAWASDTLPLTVEIPCRENSADRKARMMAGRRPPRVHVQEDRLLPHQTPLSKAASLSAPPVSALHASRMIPRIVGGFGKWGLMRKQPIFPGTWTRGWTTPWPLIPSLPISRFSPARNLDRQRQRIAGPGHGQHPDRPRHPRRPAHPGRGGAAAPLFGPAITAGEVHGNDGHRRRDPSLSPDPPAGRRRRRRAPAGSDPAVS